MCDEAGERDRVVQDAIRAAQVYPDDGVDDLLDSQTGMTEDERRWIHDYSFVDSLERGDTRQRAALFAFTWGGVDGEHHKQWVIDQMLRELLTVAEYERFCQEYAADPNAHSPWNEGIAP